MVAGMQRGRQFRILGALILVLSGRAGAVPAGSYAAPPAAESSAVKPGRTVRHWWERYRPARPTPESQWELIESLRGEGRLIRASRACLALLNAWPGSPQAPQAQLAYCRLLEQRGKPDKAFEEYQVLVDTFAGYFPYDEVLGRMYAIADDKATRPRRFLFFKFQAPEEAIPLFEKLIGNGAQWSRAAELQFRLGRIYEKSKQYDLAVDAYGQYIQRYPFGALAEQALFSQGLCGYRYARRHPVSDELRENAVALLQGFLDAYPYSDMAAQARACRDELQAELAASLFRQAAFYDKTARLARGEPARRRALEAARICYRRVEEEFPTSPESTRARARGDAIAAQLEPSP